MELEVWVLFDGFFRKPDILAIKIGTCHVLDVQVVADRFSLSLTHNTRHQKYDAPELKQHLKANRGS